VDNIRKNLWGEGGYSFLVGKPEGKRSLGRASRRWVDNIRMVLGEREVYSLLQGNWGERDPWGDIGVDVCLILG